ncbi:MAG: class I SAM-dependent methyltransferase [Bacteroidales bacterium]|nr:class I SAM-dependent methyltransferase [Bacteroidales bacterium]
MEILTSTGWTDYELIDTGSREKLERFGKYILIRPEPQAVWQKSLSEKEWESLSHARYVRMKGKKAAGEESERGSWIRKPKMPDQWNISYQYKQMNLTFRLGLTAFGHIGVFPEQAINWNYIYDIITQRSKLKDQNANGKTEIPSRVTRHTSRVLNLFAYTGGASLAAKAAGADVVHVDSVKPVITWAKEMMEASGLDNIRWVVEDAMNFVRREVKRGNLYDGIILDPPAYGRGPDGEKWILEDSIDEIIALCKQLLVPEQGFFVLSLYSMGFSALIPESLVKTRFGEIPGMECGEFYFEDKAKRKLPLGTFLRFG